MPIQRQAVNQYPMKMALSGKSLPEDYQPQMIEAEILKLEDYDKIYEMGIDKFYYDDYLWRISDLTPSDLPGIFENLKLLTDKRTSESGKKRVKPFHSASAFHPFFQLSLMRSLVAFTQDLYYNLKPAERALQRITADIISDQLPKAIEPGLGRWILTEERAGGFFYPFSIFERFWWPYTREISDAFWS